MNAVIFLEMPGTVGRAFPVSADAETIVGLAEAGRDPQAGHYTDIMAASNEDAAALKDAGKRGQVTVNPFEVQRLFGKWGESTEALRLCFEIWGPSSPPEPGGHSQEDADMVEAIRHGTFGPIVWDLETGQTRYATQDDMDSLPAGEDLTEEEEVGIEDPG